MKKHVLFSTAVLAFVLVSVSCKKNDSSSPQPDASVQLVNATPGDSLAYDFYFNDAKLNSQPVSYGTNSSYLSIAPKSYTVKVAATNTINPLASGNFNLGSGKTYSVFSYDTLLTGKVKVFATEDDLSAPPSGKAKVRFFHLSPVAFAVDILGNDSVYFANRSYADNVSDASKAAFKTVNAGTYTIKVRLAGATSTPALISIDNVSFADGKIYTVFAKGTLTGKGVNALGASIIINK